MGCSRPASGGGGVWPLVAAVGTAGAVADGVVVVFCVEAAGETGHPPRAHLTELFTDKLGPNAQGRQGPADGPGLRFLHEVFKAPRVSVPVPCAQPPSPSVTIHLQMATRSQSSRRNSVWIWPLRDFSRNQTKRHFTSEYSSSGREMSGARILHPPRQLNEMHFRIKHGAPPPPCGD